MHMTLYVHHEDGWEGTLTLEDGKLTGDPLALQTIHAANEPVEATPVGPFYDEPLTDPVGLYLLAMLTFTVVDVDKTGMDPRAMLDAQNQNTEDGNEVVY